MTNGFSGAHELATAFSREQIAEAKKIAEHVGRRVIAVLEEQACMDRTAFVERLGSTLHYPTILMSELNSFSPAFDLLSFADAFRRELVPLLDLSGNLVIVLGDPFQLGTVEWVEGIIEREVHWRLAHLSDVSAYLARYEDGLRAMDNVLSEDVDGNIGKTEVDDLNLKSISEDISPIVKLVNSTLYDAMKAEASDIHLESTETGLMIKYRVDGVLVHVSALTGVERSEQIVSRLKIMSDLDIAERRIPQDGRFKSSIRGKAIDFRVSVMPSIYGEDVVIRILDRGGWSGTSDVLKLDSLGFDQRSIESIRRLAREPYGMLLVTGPTGSGKTTTLYAAISEINNVTDKIITIEDPVEYQLPGVLQIPVNEKKGLTFSRGLRSILRHDPDKIMVGEIRDLDTAQIAVQSALTGHLVFTTVHANSVFDVIGRFTHMGVDLYSFVSSLNGVVSQRLVRVICRFCAEPYSPDAELLDISGLSSDMVSGFDFQIGSGCGNCRGTGYKGRKAIAEILRLDEQIRELIVAKAPMRAIREQAKIGGTKYLRDKALDMVSAGETTLQEINRVTLVS